MTAKIFDFCVFMSKIFSVKCMHIYTLLKLAHTFSLYDYNRDNKEYTILIAVLFGNLSNLL